MIKSFIETYSLVVAILGCTLVFIVWSLICSFIDKRETDEHRLERLNKEWDLE